MSPVSARVARVSHRKPAVRGAFLRRYRVAGKAAHGMMSAPLSGSADGRPLFDEVTMPPRERRPKPSAAADLDADAGLPVGYAELLDSLKTEIRTAQVRAALAANQELVLLYWRIGREILVRQDAEGWGAKVIDRLSRGP